MCQNWRDAIMIDMCGILTMRQTIYVPTENSISYRTVNKSIINMNTFESFSYTLGAIKSLLLHFLRTLRIIIIKI